MDGALSDDELVRGTLNGDLEAFTLLVRRYQDVTYASAYSLVQNFHDAKDIAQEVWIKVYRGLVTYDSNRHFGAWLYGISRRCAIDWLRSRQRLPVEELSAAVNIPDPGPQPDEEQDRKELCEMVQQALSSLSEVNRETTILYYINGYSQKDISGFLGVPLGTVKRRLHDSRKLLQKEVMAMVKEAFDKNKLEWKFTEDVVNRVSEVKRNLVDYLPDRFRELPKMSRDELKERQRHVFLSLVEALSIPSGKIGIGEDVKIRTSDMSKEQREYLWQTLHELELVEILSAIINGAGFKEEIENFDDVTVQVGRYNSPGKEHHNKLYVVFTVPPGNWNQRRIED